jgi:hypothetical protein
MARTISCGATTPAATRSGSWTVFAASHSIVGSTPLVPASGGIGAFGTKLIHVQRTPGTCGGAYRVNFDATLVSASAGASTAFALPPQTLAPIGAGSVSFADGEPGIKSIAVTTGGNGGLYRLTLTSATALGGGARPTTVSGAYALSIDGMSNGVAYIIGASNAQQFIFGTSEAGSYPALRAGESLAAAFVYQPSASTPATISVAQVTNPTAGGATDVEIAIAATPGRFPGSEAGLDTLCSKRMPYPGTAQTVIYALNKSPNIYCQLTAGQTYYINVRQVSANYRDGPMASCTNEMGCAVRIQPQGLN